MSYEERCREIYDEYWALVRFLANKKGVAYDDLDDICQDVFTSFYKNYGEVLLTWNEKQIKAALIKIVANATIDYFRRNSSNREFVCYEDDEVATKPSSVNEEESVLTRMELIAVVAYIDTMPPITRLIARGYFLESLTVEELSKETGIAVSAIRMRISRIRQEIRNKFKEEPYGKKNKRR